MLGSLVYFLANIFDSNVVFSHLVCGRTLANT
jgi:hypothetical protein